MRWGHAALDLGLEVGLLRLPLRDRGDLGRQRGAALGDRSVKCWSSVPSVASRAWSASTRARSCAAGAGSGKNEQVTGLFRCGGGEARAS
jgi:hypothetical protein